MSRKIPAVEATNPPRRGLARDAFSPVWLVVLVAAAALSGVGAAMAAPDGAGDTLWGLVMFTPPALATFAAAAALVVGDPADLVARTAFRITVYSAAVALACAVTASLVVLLPSVADAVAGSTSLGGSHYWMPAGGSPFWMVLLAGWCGGLVGGLLGFVLIVLPVLAIRRPRAFAEANMMSTDPKDFEPNRRAGIGLSFLIILTLAIPSLIVFGSQAASADDVVELFADIGWALGAPLDHLGELAWLLGLLLIPVAVWLLWYVWKTQRVDRDRRAAAGVPMGLPGPGDD